MITLRLLGSVAFLLPVKILYHAICHFTVGSSFVCLSFKALCKVVVRNHVLEYCTVEDLRGLPGRLVSLESVFVVASVSLALENLLPLTFGKPLVDSARGTALWVVEAPNRVPEDPVVFYLHGGGCVLQTSVAQLKALVYTHRGVNCHRLSVLAVDYALSPELAYPVALNQIAFIYHTLTKEEGHHKVIVVADSAGALLAATLMKHIHNPIAALSPVIPADKAPHAASFISPWLNLDPVNQGSYVRSRLLDKITYRMYQVVSLAYQPDKALRSHPDVNPHRTADWTGILPARMLVVAGERETLVDDILAWTHAALIDPTNVHVEARGLHDAFTLDTQTWCSYQENYAYIHNVAFLRQCVEEAE